MVAILAAKAAAMRCFSGEWSVVNSGGWGWRHVGPSPRVARRQRSSTDGGSRRADRVHTYSVIQGKGNGKGTKMRMEWGHERGSSPSRSPRGGKSDMAPASGRHRPERSRCHVGVEAGEEGEGLMCGVSHCATWFNHSNRFKPKFKWLQINSKPFKLQLTQKVPSRYRKIEIKYGWEGFQERNNSIERSVFEMGFEL
jgi:hypothetical protein